MSLPLSHFNVVNKVFSDLLYQVSLFSLVSFVSHEVDFNSHFAVKCLNCKAVSDTFDPYLDIALDIKVRADLGSFKN